MCAKLYCFSSVYALKCANDEDSIDRKIKYGPHICLIYSTVWCIYIILSFVFPKHEKKHTFSMCLHSSEASEARKWFVYAFKCQFFIPIFTFIYSGTFIRNIDDERMLDIYDKVSNA